MGELWRRLWYLLNRRRFERELQEEMDAHREMKGASGPAFGNTLRLRDESVDAWGWRWLERLMQDIRFGARLLWRAPAFTVTALVVLALGVGVNLAAFQVFDRLALAPRPVAEPDGLVQFYRRSPRSSSTIVSYPAFDFYRRAASRLASPMARLSTEVTVGGTEGRRVSASFVSANYFTELGGLPLAGRVLDVSDDRADAQAVAAISEDFWRVSLGADPTALQRPLLVNNRSLTIVGVVPRTFVGLEGRAPALWVPLTQHGQVFEGSTLLHDFSTDSVEFYGRIPKGLAATAVEDDLRLVVERLRAERPRDVWEGEWLEARDAGRLVSLEEAGPAFAMIAALVGLVLAAACLNLGLLVLARTLVRGREFAIRLSVGATRKRLARQLATEHLLLGLLGTAAGCFIAMPLASAVLRIAGESPAVQPVFTLRAGLVAAVLALFTSLTFGFAPVWQTLRPASVRRTRVRSVLLGCQVAAATTLLVVSGLLVRGVTRILRVSPGFDYQHTVRIDPDLMSHGTSAEAAADYWRRVEMRMRQLPGVRSVSLSSLPPLGNRVTVNDERTVFYDVTPEFFETMQIGVLRGRIFESGEPGVVLVSEALAKRRWPGQDPLGQRYDDRTVIGVAADAPSVRLSESGTQCYRPIAAADLSQAVMVVRGDGDPQALIGPIAAILRAEDHRLSPEVTALSDAMSSKLAGPREAARVVSTLGICALLLAAMGLAGTVAFTVADRLREIGVRVALGADRLDVVAAVVRQFRLPLVSGAAVGSLLAAGAGTVLASELFGISRFDPVAHLGAYALFAAVSALAMLPSLRRAMRVDPIQILRHE